MVFSPKSKSEINLGVKEEEKLTSISDKLARKMNIGEFRVLLRVIVVIMSRFPNTVTIYSKNIAKRTFCSFGFCERSRG